MQQDQLKKLISDGVNSFPQLLELLRKDSDISTVEELENVIKQIILKSYQDGIDGETARKVAQFQQDLGLLFKYKSYTVKCATPLGFSIFLHNPKEGFSFQQHQTHKTELFHILKVKEGGFVFLCTLNQWLQYYDQEKFQSWLNGEENSIYEQFTFHPKPGDVFVIDKVGIVHTVVGCELEEFANDSTDMVDRLHDQNRDKPIPGNFNREFAIDTINSLNLPSSTRLVNWDENGFHVEDILPTKITGGEKVDYAKIDFTAAKIYINPGENSELFKDNDSATNLFFYSGFGNLVIADKMEIESNKLPTLPIGPKQDIMILPGISWQIVADNKNPIELSEHKVPIEMAFHKFVN